MNKVSSEERRESWTNQPNSSNNNNKRKNFHTWELSLMFIKEQNNNVAVFVLTSISNKKIPGHF